MVLGVGSDFFLAGIELELARRFVERRTGAELGAEDTGDSPRALTRLEYRLIVDVFAALAKKLSDFNSSKAPGSVTKIDPQDFARISGKGPFAEVRLYADSLPNAGLWIRGPAYVFVPVDNGAKARLAKRVHDTRVELTALLGTAKLKVTDVWHLSPGVLIPLDSAVGDPLRVMVGNRHKLDGEPLVSRSNLAVKLIGNRKNGADK
jgi:flagellar motor switch protein FliM